MSPVSATYFGIPGYFIFWGMFVIAFGLFIQRIYFLFRILRIGKPENRFDQIGKRFKSMLFEVLPQWCSLRSITPKDLAGFGHALLFWGFSCFLISYIFFIGLAEGFGLSRWLMDNAFERGFSTVLDMAGMAVVVAIVWAAIRRYIVRPARLEISIEAGVIMLMVFSLMALHFCIEGFGFAGSGNVIGLPPVGKAFARFLYGTTLSSDTLIAVSHAAWWFHYALILGFMVYIPRSKHLHILASAVNIFFRPMETKVVLGSIPQEAFEAPEGSFSFGVAKVQDFKWKDLLDLYACAKCGRCHVSCPAQVSGKTLSPREVIHNLKDHLMEVGPGLLAAQANPSLGNPSQTPGETAAKVAVKNMIGDVVTDDEIWACTTCGACQEVCPVHIEHIRKVIDLRQNLVMSQSKMPESAQLMLRNMQTRGNPWAGAQSLRLRGDWTNGLDLKILGNENAPSGTLFWVGCTGALVERNVEVTLAMTRVLKAAGVDFAVLGEAESCCGDPARRVGSDFQFQIMVEENIEVLKNYNIKEIITYCPHCYNTLKNEYPKYGAEFKVIHYTELLDDLIRQGRLKLTGELKSRLTYHDPCYLSRYNEVYQEPRRILKHIPKTKLKEMERSRKTTFCCGGGGGHMWIEEQHGTTKINQVRMEEVIKTGAETVVTSCPYCLQMLEEGIEQKGMKDSLKAKDLVELVDAAMK